MSAKVDKATSFAIGGAKMSETTSSAVPTASQKVSMFATKTGFVIPKNKLSGSLVPIYRGGTKVGGSDSTNEDNRKQAQRKTKWGPDLTQDGAVRRGRALAYQTRVDQITELLKSGSLGAMDSEESPLEAENTDDKSPRLKSENEGYNTKLLELEKREAIGELLKLNPSYKAPTDYKPLLKEDKLPIPVKEYPGYNFISLIYGPYGDNRKRLEKETGAKIQICGTKAVTGEKVEIKPTDGHVIQNTFEELHVRISAETFDKIDAAISVIELLITSISGNLAAVSTSASGDTPSVSSQALGAAIPQMVPGPTAVPNLGVMQTGHSLSPTQGQFRYPGPWFQTAPSPSSFVSAPNPSASIMSHPPPSNPSNMQPMFGTPSAPLAGFSSIPQSSPPAQVLQNPYMAQTGPGHVGPPQISPVMTQQPSAQPGYSAPLQLTSGPALATGFTSGLKDISRHPPPQLTSSVTSGSMSDQPLTPAGISHGFPGTRVGALTSQGLVNMTQMAPPLVPSNRPPVPQPGLTFGASSNMLPVNINPFVTFQSGPTPHPSNSTPGNRPSVASGSASLLQGGPPSSFSALLNPAASSLVPAGSTPISSLGPSPLRQHPLQPGIPSSASGSMSNFAPVRPSAMVSPSSGDFTFQHQRPPSSASPFPRNSAPNFQPAAPQVPPLQTVQSFAPRPVNQVFPQSQVGNQLGQPQIQASAASPGFPGFMHSNPLPNRAPLPQMGPRNFPPGPQLLNSPGGLFSRPGNLMPHQHNHFAPANVPEMLSTSNYQRSGGFPFSGRPPSSPQGQQIYDPFSPTSVSLAPQQHGRNQA